MCVQLSTYSADKSIQGPLDRVLGTSKKSMFVIPDLIAPHSVTRHKRNQYRMNPNEMNENDERKLTSITYLKIAKAIIGMMATIRSNEDEKSFLHELIGYKLLEFRTGCTSYFNTRQQQSPLIMQKKKWKELILLANKTTRKYVRTYTNEKSKCDNNEKKKTCLPKVSGVLLNVKGKQCSVCGSSTSIDNEATFHRVPFVHMAPIGSTDNDNRRKKIAIHQHRRLIYLQRLNILHKKEKNYIYFCNKHKMARETFTINYKNQKGEMKKTSAYLVVPEPPKQTINNQTRSQTKKRSTPFSPKLRTRKKIRENENDNESSPNTTQQVKKNNRMRCCFANCQNNRSNPSLSWRRIPGPVPPTPLPATTSTVRQS